MDFKDYYAVLGVKPDADDQTIKTAYRKLARQYHPDVNAGDPQAEERFKAINEAYEALGDPEKRRQYDSLRQQHQQWQRSGFWDVDRQGWGQAPGGRSYTRSVSAEDLEDLFGPDSPYADILGSRFRSSWGQTARQRRGGDSEVLVEITLEEAFNGTSRTVEIDGRRIEARIPPGVKTGSRIRLSGQGEQGRGGASAGDLYLVIEVLPHAQYEHDGDDLYVEVPLDIFTAAAGGEIRVPALDRPATLKIPPRTQAGQTFRLRGKGMPRLDHPGERGDLYARVKLVLPEPLTNDEFEALRTLARARQERKQRVSV
jgi:curved DNA-binding protein